MGKVIELVNSCYLHTIDYLVYRGSELRLIGAPENDRFFFEIDCVIVNARAIEEWLACDFKWSRVF